MKRRKPDQKDGLTFEAALTQLERVVQKLEDGQLGLDESLAAYEQGVSLLKECHRLLEQAERRIEILKGVDQQGEPVVDSFDEGELSLEEKAQKRGQRRSHAGRDGTPSQEAGDIDDSSALF